MHAGASHTIHARGSIITPLQLCDHACACTLCGLRRPVVDVWVARYHSKATTNNAEVNRDSASLELKIFSPICYASLIHHKNGRSVDCHSAPGTDTALEHGSDLQCPARCLSRNIVCFFLRNRESISYKILVVYIPQLTKTTLKIKQDTIKSL